MLRGIHGELHDAEAVAEEDADEDADHHADADVDSHADAGGQPSWTNMRSWKGR